VSQELPLETPAMKKSSTEIPFLYKQQSFSQHSQLQCRTQVKAQKTQNDGSRSPKKPTMIDPDLSDSLAYDPTLSL